MTQPSTQSPKPSTIYDVAKHAGVSHQTVAMVLRGHRGFRPETRERVETALAELRYRPNLAARTLATARPHRIGALVYELTEVGPSKTIQGASARARDAGYLLDIVSLDASDDRAVHRALETLGQQDLAGVLAFAPVDQIAAEIEDEPFEVPFIAEADVELVGGAHGVNAPGMRLIAEHLAALGHRRVVHLAGPADWHASRDRAAALGAALAAAGAELVATVAGDWSARSGYEAASRLPLDAGATAIVAANDQMALGAELALAERGIDVPGDMSLTGFDDIPEAAFLRPPLTTVRVDYGVQGAVLVERLLREIDPAAARSTAVPAPLLIARASTAAAPPIR